MTTFAKVMPWRIALLRALAGTTKNFCEYASS
jgi:hypothetical protein